LRISEVLGIRSVDLIGNNKVYIRGLKGSENRVIIVEFMSELRGLWCNDGIFVFSGVNRFFVYREYKKRNYMKAFENSNRMAVTHSPRHEFIQELKRGNVELEDIKNTIGHKSIKSTLHYGEKK